jgi:hypothetical protein
VLAGPAPDLDTIPGLGNQNKYGSALPLSYLALANAVDLAGEALPEDFFFAYVMEASENKAKQLSA